MSKRKSLLLVVFAVLGLWLTENGMAGHGTSSSGSSKLFGSEFSCLYEVGDVTIVLEPIPNLEGSFGSGGVGQIRQFSEPGKNFSCTLTASDPVTGEFRLEDPGLIATLVRIGACDTGETSSSRTLTMSCGDTEDVGEGSIKADITGAFEGVDPVNNFVCQGAEANPCFLNIGGATALPSEELSCTDVFPGNTLPAGQMLHMVQTFPTDPNCGELPPTLTQAPGTKVAPVEKGHVPYTLQIAMATSMFDGHGVSINTLSQMLPTPSAEASPAEDKPSIGEILLAENGPSAVHVDDGPLTTFMCHAGSGPNGFSFNPDDPGVCVAAANGQPPGGSTLESFTIVQIDLDPNEVNTKKKCPSNTVITADIFGQIEPTVFDVRQIDFATVKLGDGVGPDEPVAQLPNGRFRVSFGDNNSDGIEDARVQFLRCTSILQQLIAGDTTLVLEGQTLGGSNFQGTDEVLTRP